MGDKDDLTMDGLLDQLRNIAGYEGVVPPVHVDPWDDDTLSPNGNKIPVPPAPHHPGALSSPLPPKQGSIIRALTDSMRVNIKKSEEPVAKIVINTDAGIKDLQQVQLGDLCSFVDSDVEINSTGGRYLIDLYHGYQLMIKRIIERYPSGSYKNPADYIEREIFDSISGIMEEDDIAEVIFELTGEDEVDGGIESIASNVFNGLNKRFTENSGWGGEGDTVMLIQRPEDFTNSNPSKNPVRLNVFKDLDFSAKP